MIVLSSVLTVKKCRICSTPLSKNEICLCSVCVEKITLIDGKLCIKCGAPLVSEDELCVKCRSKAYVFQNHRSLFLYRGEIKELVIQYKFEKQREIASLFASLFSRILPDGDNYLIVPVPSRSKSIRQRGYDTAAFIASILKKKYRFQVCSVLRRSKGKAQKTLNYAERQTNLIGKIYCRRDSAELIADRKIILLDDVFTTGATLNHCALKLIEAGSGPVFCVTIAMD